MAEEDYDEVYQYLRCQQYPGGYSKDQKRNFRRKCVDNYTIEKGILYYHAKGSKEWKQVPRSGSERERIIEACHSLPEGKVEVLQDRLIKNHLLSVQFYNRWSFGTG